MRPTAYQTEHDALREVLRGFLVAKVESSHGTGEGGRVEFGAVAALDSLLAAHPVNRRGQCRSCQRPGWLGRRRVYRVYVKAHYWLRQSAHRVQTHLAGELAVDPLTSPGVADPDVTGVLPKVAEDSTTQPLPTPAVSSSTPPRRLRGQGRPDRDHGGAGEHPECRRPRHGPSENLPPSPESVAATGGMTWPS
jgi:hypothetical protein